MSFRHLASALCSLPLVLAIAAPTRPEPAQEKDESSSVAVRCFVVECYSTGQNQHALLPKQLVETFVNKHVGYVLRNFAVADDNPAAKRLNRICNYFDIEPPPVLVYCGAAPIVVGDDPRRIERLLQDASTLTAYVRSGCPRCDGAKRVLSGLAAEYPSLRVRIRDIVTDDRASQDLQDLAQRHGTTAVSVPAFHMCNQLHVGFMDERTTGARLREVLNAWTVECDPRNSASSQARDVVPAIAHVSARFNLASALGELHYVEENYPDSAVQDDAQLPLPDGAETTEPSITPEEVIDLPVFGPLYINDVGLPLFTIAVGLVDGFNPCAMWVLLFLLSVLVNLHSRARLLLVAATFVFISAAAYFAFMAAWLNVFRFVGMLRAVQVTLAIVAIAIGLIHIKDFFALHRGITLSIPESVKPTIYEYVRRIVTAEHLGGALVTAAVLAVLVNIVELLCTAGLPALYTQILHSQQLPWWCNYAYLLLYVAAYMFDDSLMVALVVVTLERFKVQEGQGRWLKLLSGTVISVLGVVMLLRPQWLGM